MGTRTNPDVRDFFELYPITKHEQLRFALESGYNAQTVDAWIRGRVQMSKRAFDCLVAAYVRGKYTDVDEELIAAVRDTCSDRYVRNKGDRGMPPESEYLQTGDPAPPAPITPASTELTSSLALLIVAIRGMRLTDGQRLDLIRELSQGGSSND